MSETLDTNQTPQRPTFLTVLCILTFIGSGLGVIGGLLGLAGSAALSYFAPQGSMISQIIGLVAAGLCLFGAIKMWGLYKQGFTMYLLGAVISIVGTIVGAMTFGSAMSESMNQLNSLDGMNDAGAQAAASAVQSVAAAAVWTGVIFWIIINLVFILLYNANRKHLVK